MRVAQRKTWTVNRPFSSLKLSRFFVANPEEICLPRGRRIPRGSNCASARGSEPKKMLERGENGGRVSHSGSNARLNCNNKIPWPRYQNGAYYGDDDWYVGWGTAQHRNFLGQRSRFYIRAWKEIPYSWSQMIFQYWMTMMLSQSFKRVRTGVK